MARPGDARGPDARWEENPFAPPDQTPEQEELAERVAEALREGDDELLREIGYFPPSDT